MAIFHYLPLDKSPYFKDKHDEPLLPNADRFSERILRLPLFVDLDHDATELVVKNVYQFFGESFKRSASAEDR